MLLQKASEKCIIHVHMKYESLQLDLFLTDAWPTKLITYSSSARKIDGLIIVNLSCNQEMTILRGLICCLNGD